MATLEEQIAALEASVASQAAFINEAPPGARGGEESRDMRALRAQGVQPQGNSTPTPTDMGVPPAPDNQKDPFSLASSLDAQIAMIQRQIQQKDQSPIHQFVNDSPLPTGVERIDKAGQRVVKNILPSGAEQAVTHPDLASLPMDHPDRIRAMRAREGVNMQDGLPFWQRAKIALAPDTPERKAQSIQRVMAEHNQGVPEGLPSFRYDTLLDEFQFMRPDPDDKGKFRWASMDGTGLELGDLGDMIDPSEIASLAMSMYGTGKGRFVTMGRGGQGTQAAAGGLAGGIAGRAMGDALELWVDYQVSGKVPSGDDLQFLVQNGLSTEMIGTMFGEVGAKLLRSGSTGIQEAFADSMGKRGVFATGDDVAESNKFLLETQQDLERVENVLGRQDVAVTPGQATHNIEILTDEGKGIADASSSVRSGFNAAEAHEKRAMRDYIDGVWGGNDQFMGDSFGVVKRANEVVNEQGRFVVGLSDSTGKVGYMPKNAKFDTGTSPITQYGLVVDPKHGPNTWSTDTIKIPSNLRGQGLAEGMYRAAIDDARSYGKALVSSPGMKEPTNQLWTKLSKDKELGITKNKDAYWDTNVEEWRTTDGSPVWGMKEPDPSIPLLLEDFMQPGVRVERKVVKPKDSPILDAQGNTPPSSLPKEVVTETPVPNEEFRRFLRKPGKYELGAVAKEANANPFLKQQMREAVYADYVEFVSKNGDIDEELFKTWKEEVGHSAVLNELFSPADMIRLRRPGGLRHIVEGSRKQTDMAMDILNREMGLDRTGIQFDGTDIKSIYKQMKGLKTPGQRRRVMSVLDSVPGGGDGIRALFREDMKSMLLAKTKASNTTGYADFLKTVADGGEDSLIDIMATSGARTAEEKVIARSAASEYKAHLRTVGNMLRRREARKDVIGAGSDANPTALGLTRVLFGPLSRAQRFFSAARKGQVRVGAAQLSDLLTDPAQLKQLMELRAFPVESRQVSRFLQDTGLADAVWFDEDEKFDASNPQHRRRIAANVFMLEQEEAQISEGKYIERVER